MQSQQRIGELLNKVKENQDKVIKVGLIKTAKELIIKAQNKSLYKQIRNFLRKNG